MANEIVQNWKPYTVSTRAQWSHVWSPQPHLLALNLTRGLTNTIDNATLLWRSGDMMQAGSSSFTRYAELGLVGSYVRIECANPQIDWVGYVLNDEGERFAARNVSGILQLTGADQRYRVVGLEYFLDRSPILDVVHHDEVRVNRALGFNVGLGNGRDVSFSERANKDSRLNTNDYPVFAIGPENRELWNATQALRYLLHFHGPRDSDHNPAPFEINSDPVFNGPFLDWLEPTVAVEGRTPLQVVNEIVNPRRGLVGWWQYDEFTDSVELRVNSTAPSQVVLPAGTIPAAENQLPFDFDTDPNAFNPRIGVDGNRRYDRVCVRGSRRLSVFTVSTADGNLEPAWLPARETEYKAADGATNKDKADRFRKADKYQTVYRAFRIPEDWDGQSADGSGGATFEFACPTLPPGSVSILGGEPFIAHSLRLQPVTPLKVGYDYTDAFNPTSNDPANADPDFVRPLAVVQHDTKWVPLNLAAGDIDEDTSASTFLKTSYRLAMMRGIPGIEIIATAALQHALAKGHFDSGSPAPTKTKPELDYDDVRVTVCAEWDSYCEGKYPEGDVSAVPLQELFISIGDRARLDYLAEGTIYDVQDGNLSQVSTGGPIRDDRNLCRTIAQAAYEWYSTPRRPLSVSFREIVEPVSLGNLITTIGSGDNLKTVNATVTQISHAFEEGVTSISASFADIDFRGSV